MMISDLPLELVEEILSRVPAISLKRLRPTCKTWNALFKDRKFIEKHFRKAPKQSLILMLTSTEYKICPMNVDLNVVPPSIEFKDAVTLKDSHSNISEPVDIFCGVSHCDGLLLWTTLDNRLMVWNPCLGETRWIKHKKGYKWTSLSMFALGYQNNKSCRSYKILMCPNRYNTSKLPFEVYEFGSNSWRVLDNCDLQSSRVSVGGVSLQGNAYWIASDHNTDHRILFVFDFTRERCRRLCFPPSSQNHVNMAISVVREEQLSLLRLTLTHGTSKMEVWVTNKINTEAALWSKYITVELHTWSPTQDYSLQIFGSFLIDEEKKVALCCNASLGNVAKMVYVIGENKEYPIEIPFVQSIGKSWWPIIFNYIPSLVQIPQGGGK